MQVAFAVNEDPQELFTTKSLGFADDAFMAMLVRVKVCDPILVTVMVCAALAVNMGWPGRL